MARTCTLIGRVWGSRLRLRRVVVPLVSRRRRRLCHGFLLIDRRGRRVLSRWHSFVYGVQALGLGERGDFVIRREALESWMKKRNVQYQKTRYKKSRFSRTLHYNMMRHYYRQTVIEESRPPFNRMIRNSWSRS